MNELNDLGTSGTNRWSDQKIWANRLQVHDIVKQTMLKAFQEQSISFDQEEDDLVGYCGSDEYKKIANKNLNAPNILLLVVHTLRDICFVNSKGDNIFYNKKKNKSKIEFICMWNSRYTMVSGTQEIDDDGKYLLSKIEIATKFFSAKTEKTPKNMDVHIDEEDENIFGIHISKTRLKNKIATIWNTNWYMEWDKYDWKNYDKNLIALILILEHELVHALLDGLYPGLDETSGKPIDRTNATWDKHHQKVFCDLTNRMFGHTDINSSIGEFKESKQWQTYQFNMVRESNGNQVYVSEIIKDLSLILKF